MTKRRLTQFLCVFLLLFAQQVAITHAVWHAHAHPPTQHEDQDGASFQGGLCGLHGALSQVLGGVQAAAPHLALARENTGAVVYPVRACIVLELHVPPSRGPPVLS